MIFLVEEETEEVVESKRLEKEGINAAESGDIMTALEFFNHAVQVAPNRASGYNNRAQALRLKGDIQGRDNVMRCIENACLVSRCHFSYELFSTNLDV